LLLTIISFIIVLGILIFIHEFGHYITAKKVGIRVEEFALGFGPRLISWKKKETIYSIRGIPLGGFCKMTGEVPPDDLSEEEREVYNDAREKGESFDQQSALKRFAVIFNGPLMNFMLAVVIFILIFSVYGIPVDSTNSNVLGDVIPGQPAAEAGFKVGDRIIAINEQKVETWNDIANIIHNSEGKELVIRYIRNSETKETVVLPRYDESVDGGVIGISPELIREDVGFLQAVELGFVQSWYVFKLTIVGFVQMITGSAPADIGGPIMIANMVGQAAKIGLNSLLNLMAIISVNLGIINLIPFPALDGGRLIFIIAEIIRGKPVDSRKEGFVHIIGFILLMILMVILIYRDLGRTLF